MTTEQLLLVSLGALTLLTLALSLWLLWVSRRQQKQLQGLQQQLQQLAPAAKPAARPPAAAADTTPDGASFSARLDAEERYQAPKLTVARNPAEKYGYVAAMAKQGMDAVQIAAALQLAPAEVEQLLRLASLKKGG